MKYYYFIAGLPDIQSDDAKLSQSFMDFKQELFAVLSEKDQHLMNWIFFSYDNHNLLSVLENKENAVFYDLGMFSLEDLTVFIQQVKEDEHLKDEIIPPYFKTFISAYLNETPLQEGLSWENQLESLYYDAAIRMNNIFLSDWFRFNLTFNNIFSAHAARKYDFDVQRNIIGTDELSQLIRNTNSRDFGLSGMFDYLDDVLRLLEEPNILEREKKIDQLKWKYLDEKTFFHYFTIERILAYVLKMQLLIRWQSLNTEFGNQIFREMIQVMKESVNFEEE